MFKEKLLSSIENLNGTTSARYTTRNMNAMFALLIIGGAIIARVVYWTDTPLQMCQQSYMKATNEISQYNEDNPDYKIPFPIYNCTSSLLQKNATGGIAPVPLWIQELTLRDKFWLWDCRFINDFHRLGKYNLEWKAYDIACEMGKSFDIKSPWDYRIEKIWYWANLGNYIILQWLSKDLNDFTNTRIVLAHTITSLKVWYIFNPWDIVWQVDVSWASTNYHVHIELWEWYMNVSREFAINKTYSKLNGTALLNHRGWNFWQQKNAYYFTHYDLWDVHQNDSTPCIWASGKDLCYLERGGIKTMALTSDVRQEMGLKFGDKVKLIWDEGCEGVFQIEDEMNKRFRQTPWILRPWTPYYIKWDLPSKDGGVCSIIKI